MSKFKKEDLLSLAPTKSVTLSDNRIVQIRGLCVKEIKIMLGDNSFNETMVEVIQSCVLSEIDISKLPTFDIELLYLAIWRLSKSSAIVPVSFRCTNEIGDEQCNHLVHTEINLDHVKLTDIPSTNIAINGALTIKMRFPTILELDFFDIEKPSDVFDLVLRCIESVAMNGETMVVGTDIEPSELAEVMDYIDETGMIKLIEFVTNLPTNKIDLAVKCDKCGHTEPMRLSGLNEIIGWVE
ncbi:T4 family baseplate hub assembly chaperone [Shewanella sp. M-Br]|uniref:T4 family baseplate hub assembly chaperone n=1 Tax=Shewanella sp. M-Br TaxID=2495595 RepID=UPI002949A25C|nr:hypothetical protein SMBr_32720 [Shewanella sp. M-Br]